jgi:preprotein translocase SecE subunit
MAIQTKKDQNLVETLVVEKAIPTTTNEPKKVSNTKKESFFRSVVTEMSKVKWPNFKYIVTWSVMVVLFTASFSLVLGGTDHVFESGINFVSCTSPKGKNRDLKTCSTELAQKIFFVNTATR